jgi:hypothetical protein
MVTDGTNVRHNLFRAVGCTGGEGFGAPVKHCRNLRIGDVSTRVVEVLIQLVSR